MAEKFGQDLILLEKLAAGGMAEVYRAKQMGSYGFEKTVALKRILQNYASNEEFKQMFKNEAKLSGLLQNSNIAQVFGNGEYDGYLYLIMEFVDGKNVRQLLARADKKKSKIPIEISCFLASETAKGLEYAHNFIDEGTNQSLELVHRDMSPQNVMLSYDGGVKIVDFGIAKAAARSGHTKAGVLKGKFGYMSPEQAQGMPIDRRTDIFALGIILFELLTQRRLFTSDDDLKTLQLVRDCRVPRPSKYNPDVSPQLDAIVLKALKRERGERYTSAAELYAELSHFMNEKYPRFLSTDLSRYIKGLFSDDIVEERRKRERANAEIPAVMAQAAANAPAMRVVSGPAVPTLDAEESTRNTDATPIDSDTPTQIVRDNDVGADFGDTARAGMNDQTATPLSKPDPRADQYGGAVMTPQDFLQRGASAIRPRPPLPPSPVRGSRSDEVSMSPAGFELPYALGDGKSPPQLDSGIRNIFQNAEHMSELPAPSTGENRASLGLERDSELRPRELNLRARAPRANGARRFSGFAVAALILLAGMAAKFFLDSPAPSALPSQLASQNASPESHEARDPASASARPKASVETAQNAVTSAPENSAPPASPLPSTVSSTVPSTVPSAPAAAESVSESMAPPVAAPAPEYASPSRTMPTRAAPGLTDSSRPARPAIQRPQGFMALNSFPRATEVYLDGRLLRGPEGRALETPLRRQSLPVGVHRLLLKNSFYGVEWSGTVQIERDKISPLDVVLAK